MKHNIVQQKSFEFALAIIELYKIQVYQKKEMVLSKQILRSGTSIGANIEEAIGAQSRRDFLAKITISYKEARETRYWLELLYKSNLIDTKIYEKINTLLVELLKLLASIKKTTQSELNHTNL
jgi:four helix bundle protein